MAASIPAVARPIPELGVVGGAGASGRVGASLHEHAVAFECIDGDVVVAELAKHLPLHVVQRAARTFRYDWLESSGLKVGAKADDGRHISGSSTAVIVGYVRRAVGEEAVTEMLHRAGETRSLEEITDTSGWSSYSQAIALFDAAAEVTGNPEVARQIGSELLRQHHGTEVAALLRSLGSPGELLRNVAATAAKYSTVSEMKAVEVRDSDAIVVAKNIAQVPRHRHTCLYTQGVLSQASPLFGMAPAEVAETECQTRGDDQCTYTVRWDPASGPDVEPLRRLEFLEAQLASMTGRFEALQQTAAELARAGDVETALRTITKRAGLAVRAPQFLLAVRTHPTDELRVHSTGIRDEDLALLVEELLAADPGDAGGSKIVVEIASATEVFGRLAAIYPGGGRFFPEERRLLEAYAAHAAAALDTAAALETARRRDGTARALLDLAHWLSEEVTTEGVAARACDATRLIVDADRVAVWLWDRKARVASMAASAGLSAEAERLLQGVTVSPSVSVSLARMLSDPSPRWLHPEMEDAVLPGLLAVAGLLAAAAVPITSQGELYGVLVAGVSNRPERLRADDDLTERLTGVARHTATALRNARLVEQMKHQALHDFLTGLPNQRLLHDRTTQALHHAHRFGHRAALLFVDLDRFKQVNDLFGHTAGDELLKQVAARLCDVVRADDTVARIGGDEFAVLLPHVSEPAAALEVGRKVCDAFRPPFDVTASVVSVGASVGVAVYPDHGSSYEELVAPADAGMYSAKRRGGGVPEMGREGRARSNSFEVGTTGSPTPASSGSTTKEA